jgi:tryptophanyl-tRNA synthetase
MRVLSGIQPTGRFHWGNYFGAIRQYIDLQSHEQAFFFIADLHALTTIRDRAQLAQLRIDAALDLLALGLDPARATLYFQSDIPEVTELTWMLMTVCPLGLLEKCHAYKDKKAKGLPADAGLFTYPVLMAADILLYDSQIVPVGLDQVQHIEVTRDLAIKFNHLFGEVLVLPEARVLDDSAKVPGTDGEKMSKSYGNTIDVFEAEKPLRKKIMAIKNAARSSLSTSCSPPPSNSRPSPSAIAREAWGMAKRSRPCSRRRMPVLPPPAPAGPNSPPSPNACSRSWPKGRPAPGPRPARCSTGRRMPVA